MKDIERLLIEEGIVFEDELDGLLGTKGINREELAKFLAAKYSPPSIDLTKVTCDSTAAFLVPEEAARRLVAMPLGKKGDIVVVAMSKIDPDAVKDLREATGRKVKVVLAREEEIFEMINAFYTQGEVTIKANEKKEVGEIVYNTTDTDPFPVVVSLKPEEQLVPIPVEADQSLVNQTKFDTAIQEWETRFTKSIALDPIKLDK